MQLAGTLKAVLVQQLLPNVNNNGRVAACELMFVNTAIKSMIRDMKVHQIYSSMQTGGKEGMIMMDMSLARLYKQGKIAKEVAYDKCHSRDELIRYINSETA